MNICIPFEGLERCTHCGDTGTKCVGLRGNTPITNPHSLRNRYGFASEMPVKREEQLGAARARRWKPARTGVVRGSGEALRLLGPQLPGASPAGKGRRVWNDDNIVTEFRQHGRCDVAGVTAAQVEPIPQEHRTKDVNHATDTP